MTTSYVVYANNKTVECISDDGETIEAWTAPGLYSQLVAADYPTHRDDTRTFDRCIDLLVDGDAVTAHTSGEPPYEHPMGDASDLFVTWVRENVEM